MVVTSILKSHHLASQPTRLLSTFLQAQPILPGYEVREDENKGWAAVILNCSTVLYACPFSLSPFFFVGPNTTGGSQLPLTIGFCSTVNCVYVCLDSVNKHFDFALLGHFFLFVIHMYFFFFFLKHYYVWQSESISYFLVVKFKYIIKINNIKLLI